MSYLKYNDKKKREKIYVHTQKKKTKKDNQLYWNNPKQSLLCASGSVTVIMLNKNAIGHLKFTKMVETHKRKRKNTVITKITLTIRNAEHN